MRLKKRANAFIGAAVIIVIGSIAGFVFAENLALLNSMAITMVFVISLWLVTGIGGIYTLGQGVFFGLGAYTAGIVAVRFSSQPLFGLVIAAIVGGITAFCTGWLIVRLSGLRQILATILIAGICREIANNLTSLTGGSNGLENIVMAKVLGFLEFDLNYRGAYVYSLAILALVFMFAKLVQTSELGKTVHAIKLNPARARANGTRVNLRLVTIYTLAGGLAAIGGSMLAQSSEFVGLQVFSLEFSAAGLAMLIIGGVNHLWGAVIGVAVFIGFEHFTSGLDPINYLFFVGLLLMLVVMTNKGGIVTIFTKVSNR